jgi:putative heme-binding domain-containing protein
MELESGVTQFGRNPDDWGNWFGCDNSHPLFHYVLEDRYLRRNPHVTLPDPKQQVIATANPKVYPLSREGKRYHSFEHAGHYTSACSAMIYRDELLFPRSADEHAFTCEPVHNLIQHNIVHETGPTFTATHPADETDHDFVASEDPWFRPVMVRTGPDGALWIADMYRYMIEHPDWLPPQGKAELMKYYRDGQRMGRIYCVYPRDKKPRAIPNLAKLSTRELVTLLAYPNGWVRDKAQQMLIWKHDAAAISPLEDLLFKGKVAYARLHALCTLDALDGLSDADMRMAFDDEHPAIRRHALRLCESAKRLPLLDSALKLIDDPDPKVRLQLACTLGEWDSPSAGAALSKLALSAADDVYLAGAISSSLMRHQKAVAAALLRAPMTSPTRLYRDLLAMGLAKDDRQMLATLLEPLTSASDGGYGNAPMETLWAWHEALAQRHSSVQALKADKKDLLSERLKLFTPVYDWAARVAADPAPPPQRRALAASLLGRQAEKTDEDLKILSSLLTPQTPLEVQLSAVKSLAVLGGKRIPEVLLHQWTSHSPTLRSAIADVLIAREDWAMQLLHAIEEGKVAPADLDVPRRQRLMSHSAAQVKQLARNLLKENESNRQDVIDANRSVLTTTGDRVRGAKMFATHCATCHRVENVGTEIGPGLISVTNWSGEALLTAILDPDRQVEPRYLSYTAKLNNNDEIFGIITAETGGGITMKGLDGKEQSILRSNLKSFTCTNHSLMPMGFEQAMNKQELADLIAYLQTSH